jgi:hypothetical protein
MKKPSLPLGRLQLGRISTHTKGAAFGTIEQVGLYRAGDGIADR